MPSPVMHSEGLVQMKTLKSLLPRNNKDYRTPCGFWFHRPHRRTYARPELIPHLRGFSAYFALACESSPIITTIAPPCP